jgi:hypothetical protein
MTDDALLTSLLAAVSAAPDDVPLRLHVAELLAAAQRVPEALPHVTHALTVQPGDTAAIALLQRLGAMLAAPATPQPPTEFDWGQAEDQVRDVRQPAFAQDSPSAVTEDVDLAERPSLRLADVGGMEQVKQRLELSFLGPIRNPQLASAFGATAAGGLLLYGPPGCGKTFIAAPWPARSGPGSPSSAWPTCWTCGPAAASATWPRSSPRPGATPRACCSSTRSTRSGTSART